MITIVHIAGAVESTLQPCSRCGEILMDATGAASLHGGLHHAWEVGAFAGKTLGRGGLSVTSARTQDAHAAGEIPCDYIPF